MEPGRSWELRGRREARGELIAVAILLHGDGDEALLFGVCVCVCALMYLLGKKVLRLTRAIKQLLRDLTAYRIVVFVDRQKLHNKNLYTMTTTNLITGYCLQLCFKSLF